MKPPVSIIDTPEFKNTADFIAWLAEQHAKKQVVGLAGIVMLKAREVRIHSTGELNRNPHYSRGLVCDLDDRFYHMIHGGSKQ